MKENNLSRLARGIVDQYGDDIASAKSIDERRAIYTDLLEAGTYLIAFAIASAQPFDKVRADVLAQFEAVLDRHIDQVLAHTEARDEWLANKELLQ